MDLLMKQGAKLAPKDDAEAIAIFRAQVIGPLLTRAFTSHGELADAIRGWHASATGRQAQRPRACTPRPRSSAGTTASESTDWQA